MSVGFVSVCVSLFLCSCQIYGSERYPPGQGASYLEIQYRQTSVFERLIRRTVQSSTEKFEKFLPQMPNKIRKSNARKSEKLRDRGMVLVARKVIFLVSSRALLHADVFVVL